MEEGSSSRKKQKRKEDEDVAEAEFSLVVEEGGKKVGGVRAAAGSVGCHDNGVGAHCR